MFSSSFFSFAKKEKIFNYLQISLSISSSKINKHVELEIISNTYFCKEYKINIKRKKKYFCFFRNTKLKWKGFAEERY